MNIHFRNPSGALPQQLIDHAKKKLLKLQKFVPEHNYESQVFVDVHKESGSASSDSMWSASFNLESAGDRFNASAVADTAEKAIDRGVRELLTELHTARGKERAMKKREGGLWKRLRRGFR